MYAFTYTTTHIILLQKINNSSTYCTYIHGLIKYEYEYYSSTYARTYVHGRNVCCL